MTTWTIDIANELDRDAWDAYVHKHERATAYHCWAWGQACEKVYGHRVRYLIARDQGSGVVQGVLPLVEFKRLFGAMCPVSLPFCDVGGVLADSDYIATDLISEASHQCVVPLELRTSATDVLDEDDQVAKKVRMLLDLPESSELLMANFKSKLRSQIRKAEKNGLSFKTGRSDIFLEDFYQVFQGNMRDLGSPVHSFKWFKTLVEAYGQDCLIAVVYLGTQPIAAGLVLYGANGTVVPWASTLQKYNHLSSNMLLYWALLSSAFEQNRFFQPDSRSARFDFGRSTVNEGTYRFKKQWGAKPIALKWRTVVKKADGTLQSDPIQQDTSSSSWIKKLAVSTWQRLPVPVATALGSRLRGYISL